MIDGAEMDALTRWKNYLHWNPGERKAIKRQYNKRQRRMLQAEAERELERVLCDEWLELDMLTHTGARHVESWNWWRDAPPYWTADEWVTEGDGWQWGFGGCKDSNYINGLSGARINAVELGVWAGRCDA